MHHAWSWDWGVEKREIPTTKWIYLPPISGSLMGRPKQQKGNTVTKKKGSWKFRYWLEKKLTTSAYRVVPFHFLFSHQINKDDPMYDPFVPYRVAPKTIKPNNNNHNRQKMWQKRFFFWHHSLPSCYRCNYLKTETGGLPWAVYFPLTLHHTEGLLLQQSSLTDHSLPEVSPQLVSWLLLLSPDPLRSDHPYQCPDSSVKSK